MAASVDFWQVTQPQWQPYHWLSLPQYPGKTIVLLVLPLVVTLYYWTKKIEVSRHMWVEKILTGVYNGVSLVFLRLDCDSFVITILTIKYNIHFCILELPTL